jgi:pyruvate dehydrogenase E2 component (dihydrolipoyllysine-residue acetyltransferase)
VPDFTLPELGENVTGGEVLRVLVSPGDTVAVDQPVVELETEKATIEVPSSLAGRIVDVKVKVGDTVVVGQPLFSFDGPAVTSPGAPGAPSVPTPAEANGPTASSGADAPPVRETPPALETRRQTTSDQPAVADKVIDFVRAGRAAEPPRQEPPAAAASPSVRRLARELGVDVNQVHGTGPGGRISLDDVKAHAKRLVGGATHAVGESAAPVAAAVPLPDFSHWGEIDRQPLRGVRRKTAEHLSAAWATIPHVTQHDVADVTFLEDLRKRYAKEVMAAGGNLTITAIAVKVVAAALKVFPQFNASIDLAADEIVYKKYVHIGVAVDTDRGLLVPVIRDADTKNITQLSVELSQLSDKARTRKIALDELQGGCFSISNLGGIGGSFFTPIVNAPEVAILGISRARIEPVYDKERAAFAPRLMLPLSLSYDHRVVDGADGARFIRWIVQAFEQPFVLALQG